MVTKVELAFWDEAFVRRRLTNDGAEAVVDSVVQEIFIMQVEQ